MCTMMMSSKHGRGHFSLWWLLLQLFMVQVWNADIKDELQKVTQISCPESSEGSSTALVGRGFWSSHQALKGHMLQERQCVLSDPLAAGSFLL